MPWPTAEIDPEKLRSDAWVRFFTGVFRRRLRQSFHAVRLARPGLPEIDADLPLIVYCNHPSWWDAALAPVLARELYPHRRAYGPMDAAAMQRYPFMRRIGLFAVQADSYAGSATFLRTGEHLLNRADTLFCVTPQGHFVDPRIRPVQLRPGLAVLISRLPRVTVLPLALEYPFWDERTPEALARFGDPKVLGQAFGVPVIQQTLEAALAAAMDTLAADAQSRDPDRFITLHGGRVGVGGVYDGWRRLKTWCRGQPFEPAHNQTPPRGGP